MDLSLIDFDDLFDELCKRFDACEFIGVKHKHKNLDNYSTRWHGSLSTLIGLNNILNTYLQGEFDELMDEQDI